MAAARDSGQAQRGWERGRARAHLRWLRARFPRGAMQPVWSSCQALLRVTARPGESSGASPGTTFLWRRRCLGKRLFGGFAGGVKPSWSCRGPKSGSESFHLKLGPVPTPCRCRFSPKQLPGTGVGFPSQPTERLSRAGANGLVLWQPTARQKPMVLEHRLQKRGQQGPRCHTKMWGDDGCGVCLSAGKQVTPGREKGAFHRVLLKFTVSLHPHSFPSFLTHLKLAMSV